MLASDGVYEHMDAAFITCTIKALAGDLDCAARQIVEEALRRGSKDNLNPNESFLRRNRPPLIERNAVAFGKGVSLFLFLAVIALLRHATL